MADHSSPLRAGPQTGVKGIKADAQKRAETDLDLQKLTIDERNRYLESKSFQAQTHDQEYEGRAREQAERLDGEVVDGNEVAKGKDVDDDQKEDEDQAFERQWRERRLREMKRQHNDYSHHGLEDGDGKDETNDDWKLEKHRLREVGPEGFLKAVERDGWTAVLLYEPDLARCQPFIQAFVDLSSSAPSNSTVSFLKARATSLSFSLLPPSQSGLQASSSIPEDREDDDDDDDDTRDAASHSQSQSRSDPNVLPSVLVYKAGELKESFIRIDFDVQLGEVVGGGGLADELGRLFRRKGLPVAK